MKTKDIGAQDIPCSVNTSLCQKVNEILIQLWEYRNLPSDTLVFHGMLNVCKGFDIFPQYVHNLHFLLEIKSFFRIMFTLATALMM